VPRYDYACESCGFVGEIIHPISECDTEYRCHECGGILKRMINAPHVEGSSIYPLQFWNAKLPNGQYSVELKNKAEHKKFLASRGLEGPNITKWGKRRVTA
jgi:putative FmdB family regulatory protein